MFVINTLFAIGLLCSFFLPNISPKGFGLLSLISLLVPVLIIGNIAFVIYWILAGFKKQIIQPFFVLILSYFFIPTLYKLGNNNKSESKESFTIMSYNVRKFNKYKWIKSENISSEISEFINNEEPDILTLQEYEKSVDFSLNYNYEYNHYDRGNFQTGLVIFSKYPILNKGSIGNKKMKSDAIFIDIVKNNDTLRIYNFRLQSLGLIPDKDYFGHKNSEKLIKRLRNSFKFQQKQIDAINNHTEQCEYKIILAGDMNNTAYSWAYKNVRNNLKDSFLEAGKGFGKTYTFKKRFPLRIDYIFVDEAIKVIGHKNFKQTYSDHYPITATLEF